MDRSQHPKNSREFEFVQCDVSTADFESLKNALQDVDLIFWCITPDVIRASAKDMFKTNVEGLSKLLDAFEATDELLEKRFVYVSSLAVTNHFIPSNNQKESDGLPSWDTYISEYDISKRKGEELVLARNSDMLKTCSIRAGAILGSFDDVFFRHTFLENYGTIFGNSRFDSIGAPDFARALICASKKLEEHIRTKQPNGVAGQAFFITRGNNTHAERCSVITKYTARRCGFWMVEIPAWAAVVLYWIVFVGYTIVRAMNLVERKALPLHKFIELTWYDQTFDNSLGRAVLDFEPKESWKQSVDRIIEEYNEHIRAKKSKSWRFK